MDYVSLERLFGEPVTTSVTGSPQRASEVPASMEIVTADEIRRSGAQDIPGILRHVAGIDVMQWSNDHADVGIRGYDQADSSRLLVLIDGRQVYADFFGFTPWNALPVELDAIQQIEIVKGPSTALFGFNAVDGVINIITKNPLYQRVDSLTLAGGTQDLAQGSAVGSARIGKDIALRLSAGGQIDRDFGTPIPPPDVAASRRGGNRGAFDLDGELRLSDHTHLSVDLTHSDAARAEMMPFYQYYYNRYHTNSAKLSLETDGKWGLLQGSAYTNWISSLDNADPPNVIFAFHNRVTILALQDIVKLGDAHVLRASLEYRYNTESTTPFSGADVYYRITAAGGMWEWTLLPSLILTNAVRIDHLELGRQGALPAGYPLGNADWNRSNTPLSYNSGLVWHLDELDTVRLTAARGAQTPSLVIRGAAVVVSPLFNYTGVPSIDPAYTTNYELAWDRMLPALNGKLRTSVFQESTHNLASLGGGLLVGPAGDAYFTPSTVGDSRAAGLEIELKGRVPQHWRWGLSYRLERIRDQFVPAAQDGMLSIDYQHVTPLQLVKLNLGWSRDRWEADAYLQYQSHTQGMQATPVPLGTSLVPVGAYAALDARVGYTVSRGCVLSLSGQNLLQASQTQTSGFAVERKVVGSVQLRF